MEQGLAGGEGAGAEAWMPGFSLLWGVGTGLNTPCSPLYWQEGPGQPRLESFRQDRAMEMPQVGTQYLNGTNLLGEFREKGDGDWGPGCWALSWLQGGERRGAESPNTSVLWPGLCREHSSCAFLPQRQEVIQRTGKPRLQHKTITDRRLY